MLKVGIINVQWFDNPGAVLLCYSLQQFLKKMGIESVVIDYAKGGGSNSQLQEGYLTSKINKVIAKIKKVRRYNSVPFYKALQFRHVKYEDFREKYLIKTERFTSKEDGPFGEYNAYIVGSDVVWKPAIVNSDDAYVYFLEFAKEINAKRISYAASIGTNDEQLLSECEGKYKKLLKDFDYISVREKQTALFLTKILGGKITTLLDPVFLMNKDEYVRQLDLSKSNDEYIYFYMLEENVDAINFVKELAIKERLKIVYDLHDVDMSYLHKLLGKNATASISDGPREFLQNILNAKYVVTNSFHGTAFSIIFRKNFFSFSCVNQVSNVSIRMENLLETVGLIDRYDVKNYELINADIDYEAVEKVITEGVEKARGFLSDSLYGG